MESQLLATKLFVPRPRPGLVARPRLIERLSGSRDCPLIVVSAPAGFGKTTILTQWIAEKRPPGSTAWVSLDEGDGDPVRFWDYVIAALRKLRPDVGETASTMLHSPQPYPLESVLTALINDLTATPGDLAIVLDDYHLIKTDVIHDGVAFLVEHAPPGMHVVISTRTNPDLPLARLRGRGFVIEMRADDLRFTADEAIDLLQELLGTAVPPEQLDALNTKTEGWAVGLKMAALSLQGRPDIGALVASFAASNRYVMDYLLEEVLQLQSAEVRDFLLKTSVLQKLCGPLCDALVGSKGSESTLRKLENANLFIVPLDDAGQWYRYHHLFGDLLQHHLEVISGAEQVTDLHVRASQWYEEQDLVDDAVRHSLTAKDWSRATALVGRGADGLILRGEWNTLYGWFQAIPEEVLRRHPSVYAQYANVLITRGSLQTAEAVIGYLENLPSVDDSLRGELAFFRMCVAWRQGDLEQVSELGERVVEQLSDEKGAMRVRALHMLAVLDWSAGRLDIAQSRESEVVHSARRVGESWVGGTAAGSLSFILWLRGELRQALASGLQGVELIGQSPGAAWPHCMLGTVLYERNEVEEAERRSRLAVKWVELSGYFESPAYYCLARDLLAKGDGAEADDEMAKEDEASRHPTAGPLFRAWHAANRMMYAIQKGDLEAALDWGNRLAELPLDAVFWLQHAPARLLIARGENRTAAEQLLDLHAKAMSAGMVGYAIRIRVYQALAAATADEGIVFLTDALKMGEPEGFIRTFVDEGKLLVPLLRKALAQGITPEYTARLLSIIEAEDRRRKTESRRKRPRCSQDPVSSVRES